MAASGSCLGAMRSKYPEYARGPRADVVHATELLARLIEEGKLPLPRPVGRKVTYHDPCYLGRQSEPPLAWEGEYKKTHGCMPHADPPREINRGIGGVFEPPRRILRAIRDLDFVEMDHIREYAFCCGGGGGVPQAYPDLARRTALHRLEEAADVGAECLVTACHHCRANFHETQGSPQKGLPVLDVMGFAAEIRERRPKMTVIDIAEEEFSRPGFTVVPFHGHPSSYGNRVIASALARGLRAFLADR